MKHKTFLKQEDYLDRVKVLNILLDKAQSKIESLESKVISLSRDKEEIRSIREKFEQENFQLSCMIKTLIEREEKNIKEIVNSLQSMKIKNSTNIKKKIVNILNEEEFYLLGARSALLKK